MLRQLARETAVILGLTVLLLSLAATAGLPERSSPERAEASGANVPATPRPDFVERHW
jgi:hypothetical protein